jgi:thiamine-monophosphate kinase
MLGDQSRTRIDAAIAGDDYELLFAAPVERSGDIRRIEQELALPLTPIGRFVAGSELRLLEGGRAMPLPARLGYEHEGASQDG